MKRIWLVAPALLIIYCAVGMFAAPWYLEQFLQRFTAEKLGLQLELDKARLNPFNFTMQLEQVALRDNSGQVLFTALRVEAGTGFLGFWGRTGQLRSLTFTQPQLVVDNHSAGRHQAMQFFSDLFNTAATLPEATWVAELKLVKASIGLVDRSLSPQRRTDFPSFNLATDSFGPSRAGTFELRSDPGHDLVFLMEGEAAWVGASVNGRFDLLRTKPAEMALKTRFNAAFSEAGLQLDLEQARMSLDAIEWDLEQVLGVTAKPFAVDFDLSLLATHESLALREATATTGAFQILDLFSGSSAVFRVPVNSAELKLTEFVFNTDRQGEFDFLLRTGSSGEIQMSGRYQPRGGGAFANIKMVEVPLKSVSAENIPAALASENLSAEGSLLLQHPATGQSLDTVFPGLELSERLNQAIAMRGPEAIAAIDLSGQMTSGGTLRLLGHVNPARPSLSSRLEMQMARLDAKTISPFTLEFSEQEVISGALDANLDLKAIEGHLQGSIDLTLQDLELEQHTADPKRTDQALDLPVALLQDADNRIKLKFAIDAIPDEDFEFSALVRKKVAEYLNNIAALPFDALAEMLGTEAEYLQSVSFPPGLAGLSPAAVTQLEWLKAALQLRPGLSLQVYGGYDPEADQHALASQQVRLHVLLATAADPEYRSNSSPIVFSDQKVQIVLDEFASSRLGTGAVSDIAEKFGLQHEEDPQSVPSAAQREAYYRALFDALVAHETINERALLSIARYRAQAVIEQLAKQGIEPQRLVRAEQQAVAASELEGVPVRFMLEKYSGSK